MSKAVFLDRDGVLTEMVFNPSTNEYESAHTVADLRLIPRVIEPLKRLSALGYGLFLVSNQPDYAKGKVSLQTLHEISAEFENMLVSEGVSLGEYYYCYHHPKGVVDGYSYECECRKPKPFFLLEAAKKHGVDLKNSWMIGDRDIDIECGKSAGTRTVMVEYKYSEKGRGKSTPDFTVRDLGEAVKAIENAI